MIFYFRTKMKSKQALDGDGKPIKGKTEFTMPEEVPLDIEPSQAEELASPGMLGINLPTGQTLDLLYGYATIPGEILARDISWLNNRLFNAKEP